MPYCFKTDSEITQSVYNNADNYLIEYDERYKTDGTCAVYFCSNDLYFPDNEEVFRKRIVEKNFFEWYATRFKVWKHIFVRDVFKEWYLAGINAQINTTEKLAEWLKTETKDLQTSMIGSSAGGYAAMLFGSLCGAKRAFAFNPQFEVASLLQRSKEEHNPLVFRLFAAKSEAVQYFDVVPFLRPETKVYYFFSAKSSIDIEQARVAQELTWIHRIDFTTAHHGIPFLKVALPKVMNMTDDKLCKLAGKEHNPILFSIRTAGLFASLRGLYQQVMSRYRRRR